MSDLFTIYQSLNQSMEHLREAARIAREASPLEPPTKDILRALIEINRTLYDISDYLSSQSQEKGDTPYNLIDH
jgi:hypothetical protein